MAGIPGLPAPRSRPGRGERDQGRNVGRERQLHLKLCALCGEVEKIFDVLVDTGAQVSLVKAGLLPPECLTDSRRPVRLKVANGQYMVGGTREAAIGLQFVNQREPSCPDLGKEILLQGRFCEAEMDWDMFVGYDFMMKTDSGVLPTQASMTCTRKTSSRRFRHLSTMWSANGSTRNAISSK